MQYVRGNFFAGEQFVDLADAQARATSSGAADKAGLRIHGTTCAQPAVVFAEHEAAVLLPAPEVTYQVPIYTEVNVHRDYHVQVGQGIVLDTGTPSRATDSSRADDELVKLFHRGQLVKTHPRQAPGGRSTDPEDLPAEKTAYAMRDLAAADQRRAAGTGPTSASTPNGCSTTSCRGPRCGRSIGCSGWPNATAAEPVDTACGRALDLDVVSVTKIAAMLEKATENGAAPAPRAASGLAPGTVRPRRHRVPGQTDRTG